MLAFLEFCRLIDGCVSRSSPSEDGCLWHSQETHHPGRRMGSFKRGNIALHLALKYSQAKTSFKQQYPCLNKGKMRHR